MKKIIIVCFIIVLFIFIILRSRTLVVKYIGDSDDPRVSKEGISTVYEWHWENLGLYLKRVYKRFMRTLNRFRL